MGTIHIVLNQSLVHLLAIVTSLIIHTVVYTGHLSHDLGSKCIPARVECRPKPVDEPVDGDDHCVHTSHGYVNRSAWQQTVSMTSGETTTHPRRTHIS